MLEEEERILEKIRSVQHSKTKRRNFTQDLWDRYKEVMSADMDPTKTSYCVRRCMSDRARRLYQRFSSADSWFIGEEQLDIQPFLNDIAAKYSLGNQNSQPST